MKVIYPGMQHTPNCQAVRNRRYFAYATYFCVYVYELKTMNVVNIFSLGHEQVVTLSISQKRPEILAISYSSCIEIVDIHKNHQISRILTTEPYVSIGWSNNDQNILCFTAYFQYFAVYDVDSGATVKEHHGLFPNIRVMTFSSEAPQFWIGGNNSGDVTLVDENFKTRHQQYPDRGRVVASELDPNSDQNCLIVWEKGAWTLFDSRQLKPMNEVSGLGFSFNAAAWSSLVPGQFFTGEARIGIVRVWQVSSDQPLEAMTLHTSGVTALLELRQNRLLIGYNDGMIGIFDLKTRRYVFQHPAGHSNTIFRLSFLPKSTDMFLTIGGEGALCSWSASRMKQIDRIVPPDYLGHLFSMDTSPGGGVVACGYGKGNVALFSLQTRSVASEIPVGEKRIISISFNPHQPEQLLCVSDREKAALVNVETKAVLWQSPREIRPLSCAFSPTHDGTWAVTTENGHLIIWRDGSVQADLSEGPENLYFPCWSPFDGDIIATADDGGNVRIWNLKEKRSTIIGKHGDKARPVVFHPVFPEIVVSSGFDGVIMIHNIKENRVLHSFSASSNIIYGLTFSPENPHLLISAGADSALRFWSLDNLFRSQVIDNILAGEWKWIKPYEGTPQLLKLARRAAKLPGDKIDFTPSDVPHINDVGRLAEKVVKKSLATGTQETRIIKKAAKSKDRIIKAAKLELYMGNVKHYCELMFSTGEYDAAVAAAPAVSYDFWKEMMKNRAKVSQTANDTANYDLTIGMVDEAINVLLESDLTDKAFLIAAAQRDGAFSVKVRDVKNQKEPVKRPYLDTEFKQAEAFIEYSTASERARSSIADGELYLAAISFLSIGDVVSAEQLLLKHGCVSTAFAIDEITKCHRRDVRERFALWALQQSKEDSAKIFKILDEEEKKRVVLGMKFDDMKDRKSFYASVGLMAPESYKKASASKNGIDQMHLLLLAGEAEEAIRLFKEHMAKHIADKFSESRDIAHLFEIAELGEIDQSVVVFVSVYFAGYEALWRGYRAIYPRIQEVLNTTSAATGLDWAKNLAEEFHSATKIMDKNGNDGNLPYVGYQVFNYQPLGTPFERKTMYGKTFELAPHKIVTMEEALMWFGLTPISPLPPYTRTYFG